MCNASVKVINTPSTYFSILFRGEAFKLSLSYLKLLNLFTLTKTLLVCEVWRRHWSSCSKRNRICDESVIPSLKAENNLCNIKNIWNKSQSKKRNEEKKKQGKEVGENEEREDIKKRKRIIRNEGKGRRKEEMPQTELCSTVVVVLDESIF